MSVTSIPADIKKKAERRTYLWHKNNGVGLTAAEVAEYRRVAGAVNRFIKKTWPESWESCKRLQRLNGRMRVKKAKAKKPVGSTKQ